MPKKWSEMTRTSRKKRGIYTDKKHFEDAVRGESAENPPQWDPNAIQWVDYWDEECRNDPDIEEPWCDMTLMVYSYVVGDFRPATVKDLARLGYLKDPDE